VEELLERMEQPDVSEDAEDPRLPTVLSTASRALGQDWEDWLVQRISFWASAYADRGQASWPSPWREQGVWAAWKREAEIDRTLEVAGLQGFRGFIAELPECPEAATEVLVEALGVPTSGLDLYIHRLLMTVPGWAGWFRFHQWEAELAGSAHEGLRDLAVILLAFEAGFAHCTDEGSVLEGWTQAREEYSGDADLTRGGAERQLDLVCQSAFEMASQESLLGRLKPGAEPSTDRPEVQAAFCIDVRSEVFRRALETRNPGVETIGFAGFFGFALTYQGVGQDEPVPQCPVLLSPALNIQETVADDAVQTRAAAVTRAIRRRASVAWNSFKMGAVSCFGFVGPVGLLYAWKLASNAFGWSRPVAHPRVAALTPEAATSLKPSLTPANVDGQVFGMDAKTRLDTAEGVLRAMSLSNRLARLVLLAGHGSTTVNNPHAAGLDCGACGGRTGEANARVAAAVLNDPEVRAGLAGRGIQVPEDTWFVAGQHDTTTDEVSLFDLDEVPDTHAEAVRALQEDLRVAAGIARIERAPALGLPKVAGGKVSDARTDRNVLARSRDWSQVRPEWGLAGCAAFVAAPRERTQGMSLGGRSFLHSYAWQEDDGFGVLELIMTAPMVVASWISLQYFGSTVDNRVFGSGNKTLHNVAGTVGVLEGNGGDLRTGLPLQSLHDGRAWVHDPVRLNVVIEAPMEAMNEIISRHDHVRDLVDNGWLNLWAMDAQGAVTHRYNGALTWKAVPRDAAGEEGQVAAA
jgi:uncharacterized protein YbcC (UPF0753/DUF2309 family)